MASRIDTLDVLRTLFWLWSGRAVPQPRTATQIDPAPATTAQEPLANLVFSPGCTNAQLVSALSNDDAGTHQVANGLFGLPLDLVNVALGLSDNVNQTAQSIPAVGTGAISGTAACLAKCAAQRKMA